MSEMHVLPRIIGPTIDQCSPARAFIIIPRCGMRPYFYTLSLSKMNKKEWKFCDFFLNVLFFWEFFSWIFFFKSFLEDFLEFYFWLELSNFSPRRLFKNHFWKFSYLKKYVNVIKNMNFIQNNKSRLSTKNINKHIIR